jgi:hypothetical protein
VRYNKIKNYIRSLALENQFIPVKKIKIALYILFFTCLLGLSVFLLIMDKSADVLWDIITYLCIALVLYFFYIYGLDLFSNKAGLNIKPEGLYLNLEYYKGVLVSWKDITDMQLQRLVLLINVKDSEKYLNQIPKVSRFVIKGNTKRFGTIFVIRYGQLDMQKDALLEELNSAWRKYKRKK